MRIGVNYVPRRHWFYQWYRPQWSAVSDDFHAIKELGVDHVRIFPLWQLMQPNRTWINQQAIDDVVKMVHLAGDVGLHSTIDVLQGHLSSYDFLPSWVSTWHQRNIFTDDEVKAAQIRLITHLAHQLRDCETADGLSVGNEIIQFAALRHPHRYDLTPSQADSWLCSLYQCMKKEWPQGTHTFSYDDDLLFEDNHPFTPICALRYNDIITVHSWVFGLIGRYYGSSHSRLTLLARYLLEIFHAWSESEESTLSHKETKGDISQLSQPVSRKNTYSHHSSRRLWLQEVGAPLTYIRREETPEFLTQTLHQAVCVDGLDAITWWCSHDVSEELADFPPVEYSLGLFDVKGKIKPLGQAFQRWIASYRQACSTTSPSSMVHENKSQHALHPRKEEIFIPPPSYPHVRQIIRPDGELFSRWAARIEQGDPAQLRVYPLNDSHGFSQHRRDNFSQQSQNQTPISKGA